MRLENILATMLSFNLNSDVVLYSTNKTGFTLTECYSIKEGSPISHFVGTWNRKDGLVLPEKSIWERRSNLLGVSMDVVVGCGYSFLMKVNNSEGF